MFFTNSRLGFSALSYKNSRKLGCSLFLDLIPFSANTLKKSSDLMKVIVKCLVLVLTFCSKATSWKNSYVVLLVWRSSTISITMILTDF